AQSSPDVIRPAAITDLGDGSPGSTVVFVGAGDIAVGGGSQEATARLLDGIPGTVFTLGDNAYPDGTASNYATYYDPSWGRHKARTKPCPGNHDYHTANGAGYFTYFGSLAGPSGQGYYSFDLGDWHIISLDGEISTAVGSPQEVWLRADLAAHTNQCCLAYWHEPLFDSGNIHGGQSQYVQPLWQALYDYHAEIILNGHEHIYERFAPQTPGGAADPANGIREFIVGTGGAGLYTVTTPKPNSEVHN
ncbi:MAG: alkaline phosphatase, partial [Actinobacteria bacterium]